MKSPETMLLAAVIGSVAGFFFKIIWEHYISGRVEKTAPYVKNEDCQKHRDGCCNVNIQKDVAKDLAAHETRLNVMDKRLDQGSEDFRRVGADLGEIKQELAGLRVFMETKVEKVIIKTKE